MHSDVETMRKYYSTEEAWERRRRYYEEGPSEEWQELYRDVRAALGEDPAGAKAQALADRWLSLSVRAWMGDPDVQTDSGTAWMDREHWPPTMKRRIAEFGLDEAHEFIQRAAQSARKKYFTEDAWARMEGNQKAVQDHTARWQERVDLFRDVESCLGEDPAGEKARALAARWKEQLEAMSGGEPAVKAGLLRFWADRRNWTATIRWREEILATMDTERFEKAADFLDRAVACAEMSR